MKNILIIALLIPFSYGCRKGCTNPAADNYNDKAKKDDGSCVFSDNYDRKAMLTSYADVLIIPGYADLSGKLSDLNTTFQNFKNTPDTTQLMQVEAKWREALKAWQHVAYFEFGPADQIQLRSNMNLYPTDTVQINTNINSGVYDLDAASNLDAKGFQAVDYLINAQSRQQTISLFTNHSKALERMQYMENLISDMKTKVEGVHTQWLNSYRISFISSTGLDVGSSTNQLFNAYVMHFEQFVRQGKLGIPVGALSFSQVPLPDKTEAFYQQNLSKELLSEAMIALDNIYNGNTTTQEGVGFSEYLNYLESLETDGDLDGTIKNQINEAQTAISTVLENPLSDFVVNQQSSALQVWEEMQMLVVYLKNDLKSKIGLSITYADADGD